MNAEPFDDTDGVRVWLDQSETETLLAAADRGEERTAFVLGVRSWPFAASASAKAHSLINERSLCRV